MTFAVHLSKTVIGGIRVKPRTAIYEISTLMLIACLVGCVMGIPDSGPAMPKIKPCEKIIVVYPERIAVCMTTDEFNRWARRNLPTSP